MLFSSLTFIFAFLPLLLFLYFLLKKRWYRNFILLLFSILFYAWGEPKYIFLMLLVILISYIAGILIDKLEAKNKTLLKNITFILSLILIIGNLIYFKYANFIVDNINNIFKLNISIKAIVLPIGISFYTFQILSYIIDVYRKKIPVQKNILDLSLYVTLFPQLVAGPIVRYETVQDELENRKENLNDIISGVKRFIIGLSKKIILANNVALLADFIFDNSYIHQSGYGSLIIWLGAIAYSLQIYYDFSGYSDMAIGLGQIFGFHFLENFNYPYISRSITEFWRRWHISLSSWFRVYVYIPLGGNRVSKFRWILNLLVVWALTGLWHGASWNFIIWGLYFCFLLILEKIFLKKFIDKWPSVVRWLYSIILIIIGWVIFRVENISEVFYFIKKLFDFSSTNYIEIFASNNLIIPILFIIPSILFMFPIYKKIENLCIKKPILNYALNAVYLGLFLICIMYLISSNFNPFIYFRF